MQLSKHNIVSKVADSELYYVVNPLSGNADLMDAETYRQLIEQPLFNAEFVEKGYVVEAKEEGKNFKLKYLEFLEMRESDEVQIFFVTNYSCNFDCAYCYQAGYSNPAKPLSNEVIDAFYNYIDTHFKNRNKYITIFGGEPFIKNENHFKAISYLIEQATLRGLSISAVSNGFNLLHYADVLKNALVREIQLTLDGTEQIHNKRRYLKGGGATFQPIVEAVDWLLSNQIPVNLRMVVDKQNINDLPNMAQFAIDKGWTKSPLFKTQLGRNYELHECQADGGKLYSRLELYQDIFRLVKEHPQIVEFHQPAFSVSKFLFEQGELPQPLFDACTGTKTEWAFDYTGNIYACTATVGKEDESLGTFYPEVKLKKEDIDLWQERDILSIDKCKNCNVALVCGGGCASMAKNKNGSLHSSDCRPVSELLSLGMNYYFADKE